MRVIIDRLEGDIAVVECSGEMLSVPAKLFENAKEGDHVEICVIKRKGSADAFFRKADDKEDEKNIDTKAIFERLRKKSKESKDE